MEKEEGADDEANELEFVKVKPVKKRKKESEGGKIWKLDNNGKADANEVEVQIVSERSVRKRRRGDSGERRDENGKVDTKEVEIEIVSERSAKRRKRGDVEKSNKKEKQPSKRTETPEVQAQQAALAEKAAEERSRMRLAEQALVDVELGPWLLPEAETLDGRIRERSDEAVLEREEAMTEPEATDKSKSRPPKADTASSKRRSPAAVGRKSSSPDEDKTLILKSPSPGTTQPILTLAEFEVDDANRFEDEGGNWASRWLGIGTNRRSRSRD